VFITGEKKLVPVSMSIVEKASQIARRKMSSLSKLVEDAVKYAIRLEEELGVSLEDSYTILRAVKTLRVLGGVFTPQLVFECLLDENCRSSRERLLEKWFESGKTYGSYLRDSSSKEQVLRGLLEVLRWDLSEVRVDNEGGNYRVKCTATAITSDEAECIAKFIEGVVVGLNCNLVHKESMRGLVIVEFKC
jgi:hypothetical protein